VGINLSINGVIPWRQFVPEDQHPEAAYIASAFIERLHGPIAARIFTVMVLWTCVGSVVALLLGYSRIPYAAARDGVFFGTFGRLHPRLGFPHLGLLLIGLLAIAGSFLPFGTVLDTLIALRILVQFVAQIAAVVLLRRHQPDLQRPYRIWLYPLPLMVALCGWLFVFVTSPVKVIAFSMTALLAGVIAYGVWSWRTGRWPFGAGDGGSNASQSEADASAT
jgi:amino acid transporter